MAENDMSCMTRSPSGPSDKFQRKEKGNLEGMLGK